MSLKAKLAALAVAAALVAQPLAAVSACWQDGTAQGHCPSGCLMPGPRPTAPVKVEPGNPDCCEISSSEPQPWAKVTKSLEAAPAPVTEPETAAAVSAEVGSETPVGASSPRALASSLHILNCVFLI